MKITKKITTALCLFLILALGNAEVLPINPERPDGCPDYIPCDHETGKLLSNWMALAKPSKTLEIKAEQIKQFFNNSGLPIFVWYRGDVNKIVPSSLIWDSPCKSHQSNPEKPISLIQSFIKKFPDPGGDKEIISGIAMILNKDIVSIYPTPARSAALFVNGDRPHFQLEDQGVYVHYEVDTKGNIYITDKELPPNFTKEVLCPEKLSLEFLKIHNHETIYANHYCKQIWNSKLNSYQTILYGWSCN